MTQTEEEDWERPIREELQEAAKIRDRRERAEKSIDVLRLIEDKRGRMDTVKQSDWVRDYLGLPGLVLDPFYKPRSEKVDLYRDPITDKRLLLRQGPDADSGKTKKKCRGYRLPKRRRASR